MFTLPKRTRIEIAGRPSAIVAKVTHVTHVTKVTKVTKVVLFGNTVYLSGVSAILADRPEMEVVNLHPDAIEAERHLHNALPDAVVFDTHDRGTDPVALLPKLLRRYPGTTVIGLDLSRNEVSVLSGHVRPASRMHDLIEAIRRGVHG